MNRTRLEYYLKLSLLSLLLAVAVLFLIVALRMMLKNEAVRASGLESPVSFFGGGTAGGLRNTTNACFFNAVVQVLYSLNDFRDFIQGPRRGDERKWDVLMRNPVVKSLHDLFESMSLSTKAPVDASEHYARIISHFESKSSGVKTKGIVREAQNCAAEFMALLVREVLEAEQNVASETRNIQLTNTDIRGAEVLYNNVNMVHMFGIAFVDMNSNEGGVVDDPKGKVTVHSSLNVGHFGFKAVQDIVEETLKYMYGVNGPDGCEIMRIPTYLTLNMGVDGFNLRDVSFRNNDRFGISGHAYELCGVLLHSGRRNAFRTSGHYVSYSLREGIWYYANQTICRAGNLYEVKGDLAVSAAVFRRVRRESSAEASS